MTASELFAIANGFAEPGSFRCFYCGAACPNRYPVSQYVRESFTGLSTVAAPASPVVCRGCGLAMNEHADITMLGGETRTGQRVRSYSWFIMVEQALAATKAHLDRLRAICLDPPRWLWSLVLSNSGQTHQIYRGVVNYGDRSQRIVTLEGERIAFARSALAARLELVGRLVAAAGKPAMHETTDGRFWMAVMDRYGDQRGEELLCRWQSCREQPLSRLAVWLSPNKEQCSREYPD